MKLSNLVLLTIVGIACMGIASAQTSTSVDVTGGVKACSAFTAPAGVDFGATGLDATATQPIMSPVRSYTISWCGPYDVKCEAMPDVPILTTADGRMTVTLPLKKLHETLKLDFITTADPINKIFDCGDITMPIESGAGTPTTTHNFKYSQKVLYTDAVASGYKLVLKWTASTGF